jgi:tetratricopeptide (TPR) repeat protein
VRFILAFASAALAFQPDFAYLRRVYEEHLTRCERDFGPADARTAQAARDLGFYLRDNGESKAAAAAFGKALSIDGRIQGPDAPVTLAGIIALASVSSPDEAEVLFRKALTSRGMNSKLAAPALSALGDLRFAAHDKAGAAAAWRLALQHSELVNGKESDSVGKILYSLSLAVDPKESVTLLERALDIAVHNFGPNHPETATCDVNLANALLQTGRPSEAAVHARRGLAALESSLGPGHPRVAIAAELYRRASEIDRQTR